MQFPIPTYWLLRSEEKFSIPPERSLCASNAQWRHLLHSLICRWSTVQSFRKELFHLFFLVFHDLSRRFLAARIITATNMESLIDWWFVLSCFLTVKFRFEHVAMAIATILSHQSVGEAFASMKFHSRERIMGTRSIISKCSKKWLCYPQLLNSVLAPVFFFLRFFNRLVKLKNMSIA